MKITIDELEEGVITDIKGEWECENLSQIIAEVEIIKFYLLNVYDKRFKR